MKNRERSAAKLHRGIRVMLGAVLFVFCLHMFSFESVAAEGKVKPASAKIRSEANTSSEALASVESGDELTVKGKVTGSDGKVWYQVFVDANTLGYIRSDLLDVDGTVSELQAFSGTQTEESAAAGNTSNTGSAGNTETVTITVEPMASQSATITGGDVNVRQSASTSTSKVATAKNGTAVTVTGQANGSDGKLWYQVSFISDGSEVTGFIRSDYIELGEVIETPETQETPPEEQEAEPEQPQSVSKAYETVLESVTAEDGTVSDVWYLYDNEAGYKYSIPKLMAATTANEEVDAGQAKQVKQQKIIIIVMAVAIVILVLGVTLLLFKLRDGFSFGEGGYDEEEEDEEEVIPVQPARRPVPKQRTVGEERTRRQTEGQTRPKQGTRPSQGERPSQGTRPKQGTRPPQGERPSQGTRPSQGAARTGAAQGAAQPARRPATQPVKNGGQGRPAPKPAAPKMPEQEVTYEEEPKLDMKKNPSGSWHSKNFLADDDEFEFEFLNMDDPNKL